MLLCNLVLENFRSMIVAIDVLQNLHMLVYLAVWWHPAVEAYLQSLNILAFKAVLLAPSLFNSSTAPLGKCMSKRIYIYGFCDILN